MPSIIQYCGEDQFFSTTFSDHSMVCKATKFTPFSLLVMFNLSSFFHQVSFFQQVVESSCCFSWNLIVNDMMTDPWNLKLLWAFKHFTLIILCVYG